VPEENFWTSWCKRRLTEADITYAGAEGLQLQLNITIYMRPISSIRSKSTMLVHG